MGVAEAWKRVSLGALAFVALVAVTSYLYVIGATDRAVLSAAKYAVGRTPEVVHTVKTGAATAARLEPVLNTWYGRLGARAHAYVITDRDDVGLRARTGNRTVATGCRGDHGPYGLTCKMQAEFDIALQVMTSSDDVGWWCHWDDDNYVNLDNLDVALGEFDPRRDKIYLGRTSVPERRFRFRYRGVEYEGGRFAHGGCGFCVSRHLLVDAMAPWAGAGGLEAMTGETQMNDDCVVGFLVTAILATPITESLLFNSHYHHERLTSLTNADLKRQVSLSYGGGKTMRLAPPQPVFAPDADPTRFYSLHCLLYPDAPFCALLPEQRFDSA